MLAKIRVFAKSPIAVVLFGLLVISFAVFGISDVFTNRMAEDAVVKAGSRTIRMAEFKQIFDQTRRQYEQQSQQQISAEQAVAGGLDKQILQDLADGQSFAEMMSKLNLRPSDKLVVDELEKAPVFFDQITGKFDRKAYDNWLAQNNMTADRLEQEFRDNIAQTHFYTALMAGLQPPRVYGAVGATLNQEGRTFTWFQLSQNTVGAPPMPTDAQLTAYIKANAARFTKPETRQLSVVRYAVADTLATVALNEADVQKRFEFEKDAMSTPEKRSIAQVPLKDRAQAADVVARLRRGEDPNAVAKALGVQAVIYADAPKTAIADRKVADAAFALKQGEVAGPVEGTLGLAAVIVGSITPGRVVTLADPAVRQQIETKVRTELATEKVYEEVQKFQDARSAGASMAEAAKKLGLAVVSLPPVDAQGQTLDGRPIPLMVPEKALATAFGLPQTGESEMEEVAPGEYYAVRVDKIAPAAPVTLEEARGPVTQSYMLDELMKRGKAKSDELAARIRKGETPEAVAGGAQVRTTVGVRRDGSGMPFSREFLTSVFGAKKGETVSVFDQQLGFVVLRLDDISTGDPKNLAAMVAAQRAPLGQAMMRDVGDQLRLATRDTMKPRTNEERARSAIGVAAAPTTPATGTAPAPAPKP